MHKEEHKCALVVEGGAMRGIFATGVLDSFIEADFNPFDLCIGVSAGATNLAAYLAGMKGRNYKVYKTYSLDKKFISLRRFLMGGHYMDLDWMWAETIRDMRLDLNRIVNGPSRFLVGVTNANTGEAEYLEPTIDNVEDMIKASSALPVVYRGPVTLNRTDYSDGGISAPIPVDQAIKLGCKTIVVLRSRPYDFKMTKKKQTLERLFLKKQPNLLRAVIERPKVYNNSIDLLRANHPNLNIIAFNPTDDFATGRFTKDLSILKQDYEMGINIGKSFAEAFSLSV